MLVCICNGLTSRQIAGAIRDGAASVDAVYRGCGVEPRCGQCGPTIHCLLSSDAEASEQPGAEGWPILLNATAA